MDTFLCGWRRKWVFMVSPRTTCLATMESLRKLINSFLLLVTMPLMNSFLDIVKLDFFNKSYKQVIFLLCGFNDLFKYILYSKSVCFHRPFWWHSLFGAVVPWIYVFGPVLSPNLCNCYPWGVYWPFLVSLRMIF